MKNYAPIGYNVLQICDGRAFQHKMFIRSTALSVITKLSAEHEAPPIANVLLAVRCFSIVIVVRLFLCFL